MLELLDRLILEGRLTRKDVDRFSMLMTFNKVMENETVIRFSALNLDATDLYALINSRQWNAPALWAYLSTLGTSGVAIANSLSEHFTGDTFRDQMIDLLWENFGPAAGAADPANAVLPRGAVEQLEPHGWEQVRPWLMKGVFRGKNHERTQLVFFLTDGPNRYFLASPVMETDLPAVPQWILDIEVSYAWDMIDNMIVLIERLGAADDNCPKDHSIFAREKNIAFRADELESATGPRDLL